MEFTTPHSPHGGTFCRLLAEPEAVERLKEGARGARAVVLSDLDLLLDGNIVRRNLSSELGFSRTSTSFTDVLKRESIVISMDGRGRALDNIFVERLWRSLKYEDIYLKEYAGMGELTLGLTEYFAFYNAERPHQSLGNRTPQVVYESAQWGGAVIVDRVGKDETPETTPTPGQRRPAACEEECTA